MIITSQMTALSYFFDVATLKSFSKAAQKNHVSQSAISQAIRKLEGHTNQKLFHHHKNACELTSEGRVLYLETQKFMGQLNHFERFIHRIKENKMHTLHFGCVHSIALSLLPPVLKQYKSLFPSSAVNFQLGNGPTILNMLEEGKIDFGILLNNQNLEGYYTLSLYQGFHEVYEAKTGSSKTLMVSNLSTEAMQFAATYKKEMEKNYPIEMEISSWEVIAEMTQQGLARGFFPDYLTFHRKNLRKVLMPFPSQPYEMVAAFRSERYVTSYALEFVELFKSLLNSKQ